MPCRYACRHKHTKCYTTATHDSNTRTRNSITDAKLTTITHLYKQVQAGLLLLQRALRISSCTCVQPPGRHGQTRSHAPSSPHLPLDPHCCCWLATASCCHWCCQHLQSCPYSWPPACCQQQRPPVRYCWDRHAGVRRCGCAGGLETGCLELVRQGCRTLVGRQG